MNFLRLKGLAVFALLLAGNPAMANDAFWFGVKAGSLGYGAEASWRPIEWLDVRGGFNMFEYDDSRNYGGINYDGTLDLQTYYLTGNFRFPLSPFRLTLGAHQNGNEVRMASQDMGSYPIGDNPTPYSPADVGTIRSTASFDDFAPYIGAGFDFDILDRLGLSLDFGVLWQGSPSVTMRSDGLLANDPGFLSDLEVERQAVEEELENLKAYPVISVGLNFNFF